MEFTVRELEFGDIFTATKIFKKVDIKPYIKEFGSIDKKDKTPAEIEAIQNEKGIEFFMFLLDNIDTAETEISKLLGDITGLTVEGVKKLKFSDMKKAYEQFMEVNSMGNVVSFFKKAIDLMK